MPTMTADLAWRECLLRILRDGRVVSPRGQKTIEVLHTNWVSVDMHHPVIVHPVRKLNYKFMAAEALWILRGDNKLEPLTKHVKRMAEFSDDGSTLAGAYGPKIVAQLQYVLSMLLKDRDTRQAVLSIWERNPQPSKDIPCTIAMSFSIRDDKLHSHVFMRSSDAWLGIPYDIFSFTMVAIRVACLYNQAVLTTGKIEPVDLGNLTVIATSSHLYERNFTEVDAVLESPVPPESASPRIPYTIIKKGDWITMNLALEAMEAGVPSFLRPSEVVA